MAGGSAGPVEDGRFSTNRAALPSPPALTAPPSCPWRLLLLSLLSGRPQLGCLDHELQMSRAGDGASSTASSASQSPSAASSAAATPAQGLQAFPATSDAAILPVAAHTGGSSAAAVAFVGLVDCGVPTDLLPIGSFLAADLHG